MSYRINRVQDGAFRFPLHAHKNYEIILYCKGHGTMRTELGDVPFAPGTIIIVPPNIRHGTASESDFEMIFIAGDFEGYLHFDTVKSFADNTSREGMQLARMIYDNRYGNEAYLTSLCTAYLCFLMQRFDRETVMEESVKKIIFEISQHAFVPEIDLTAILSKSGYSEDYIRVCFKKATGKTPHEFLTDIRIKHACFLIDIYKNDLSLSEIAERCGYVDYVYFSKKFKALTGLSPKEYKCQ